MPILKPRSTAFCHRRASFGRQCYHCNRPIYLCSNSPAMFAHDRKLPGVHTDQVKLLQDMGFPADSWFKLQWVDDLFSIISQHQAGGINVCVCQQNDMPSIGGYIEDTLILSSCHTTGFLQTCWGKKTTVEFMIVPTPCDLCKRCVWECGDSAASLDSTSMVSCVCVMLFVL